MLTVPRFTPRPIAPVRRWLPCAALALLACSEDAPILRRDSAADALSTMDGGEMDSGSNLDAAMDATLDAPSGDDAGADGERGADGATELDTGADGGARETDAAPRDARTGCVPGTLTCATADRTRECLDDGGFREAECPAGQVCAEGLGCRACEPGARRCAASGAAVEECRADGSGFAMMTACDAAAGQVCDGFRCVDLCARAASQRGYPRWDYVAGWLPQPLLAHPHPIPRASNHSTPRRQSEG